MPKVHLSERFDFAASHRLANSSWTQAENERVFGLCAGKHVHGHNFSLWVTVVGNPSNDGTIANRGTFRDLTQRLLIDRLDNANLNELPLLHGKNPTCEHLSTAVAAYLGPLYQQILGAELSRVTIVETERNHVDLALPQ